MKPRKAFDWFLGQNDLHVPLYDFRTKGCNDGLTPNGINTNQGAESTLSFLLSLLSMVENYAVVNKTKTSKAAPLPQTNHKKKIAKKKQRIESIPAKTKTKKKQAEKLT